MRIWIPPQCPHLGPSGQCSQIPRQAPNASRHLPLQSTLPSSTLEPAVWGAERGPVNHWTPATRFLGAQTSAARVRQTVKGHSAGQAASPAGRSDALLPAAGPWARVLDLASAQVRGPLSIRPRRQRPGGEAWHETAQSCPPSSTPFGGPAVASIWPRPRAGEHSFCLKAARGLGALGPRTPSDKCNSNSRSRPLS